jgi:hypothetical protein
MGTEGVDGHLYDGGAVWHRRRGGAAVAGATARMRSARMFLSMLVPA